VNRRAPALPHAAVLKIRHRDGRLLSLYAAVSPWSGEDAADSPAAGQLTPAVCVPAGRNSAWRDADELAYRR
jgi:hypothetical protein